LQCHSKHFGILQLRDQTRQPPFRVNLASVSLVCPFRRAEFAPAPAPDSRPAKFFSWRAERLASPRTPRRDRTAQSSTPPSLPLHSGSQVSSLRRTVMTGRVEFATSTAPRPPLADLVANSTPPGHFTRERMSKIHGRCDRDPGRHGL
jgi:hypothetical protein